MWGRVYYDDEKIVSGKLAKGKHPRPATQRLLRDPRELAVAVGDDYARWTQCRRLCATGQGQILLDFHLNLGRF
jgi:hypothetical protein